MIPPKKINKAQITDTKEIEIYEQPDKDSRIIILFSKLQEHKERQLNKI